MGTNKRLLKELFGDLIRTIKGKALGMGGLDYVGQEDGRTGKAKRPKEESEQTKALSCLVAMTCSEGTRCLGMPGGAIMAFDLLKHGHKMLMRCLKREHGLQ